MFSSTSTSPVHWFLFIRLIMEIVSIFFWLWKWPKHIIKIETTQKRGSWSVTWKHTRKHTQMQNREDRFKSLLISRTYLPQTKQTSPSWKYVKFRCGSLVCLTLSQLTNLYQYTVWTSGSWAYFLFGLRTCPRHHRSSSYLPSLLSTLTPLKWSRLVSFTSFFLSSA